MAKVSVIIPVYGVEPYVEKCARSLFEQTLDDLEYIFINDCTPDGSMEIILRVLEDYPHRRSQVKIINNKNNLGQSRTRRKGVNLVSGEYVIHCDSDDWVRTDCYETMYKVAKLQNADLVWCDFYKCYDDGRVVNYSNEAQSNIDDALLALIVGPRVGTLWSNLVKREIVQSEDILWPTWNYCEDLSLIFQYTAKAQKISYLSIPLYYYRENLLGITNVVDRDKVIANTNGAINAVLSELECSKRVGLYDKFKPYCKSEILKAKCRVLKAANNNWDACRLWNGTVDHSTTVDIIKSKLPIRLKLVFMSYYFYLYPIIKSLRNLL